MKTFNTVGCCIPDRHYMVNIDDKLKKIKNLVDGGYYFVINRARQYGKTTTLGILAERLKDEYVVISLDFQMMSDYDFRDEATFVSSFAEMFLAEATMPDNMLAELRGAEESGMITGLRTLFIYLSNLCEKSDKPVVLMSIHFTSVFLLS